ncbi:alpha-2-macroglobulin family protein [Flavobacterium agrisoli]|uniref:Carboxypeptidase-like regulatory domain-containing protein n=1 Tax=Flavobacterium agrisoli TaxID=2793066 RepID=A0A934PQC4_9FLAO|nr:carboxypeptidase-like regulatory domain-containing protein [Flavobacterium agrisoli]MBK0370969.1 carboxypeptidase-like regulatory domain-containing protein [Flavobacterium agrisoli]
MKKLLCFFLLITSVIFGQNFDKNWQKVIDYENLGKIKSANQEVEKIYKKAYNKKNEPQIIKTFFYRSKYKQVLDENAKKLILIDLKTQINQVSIPSKAILNLVYAKGLHDYNEDYSEVFAIVDTAIAFVSVAAEENGVESAVDSVEVATFNKGEEIVKIFDKTLENEAALKATSLTNYEAIFDFFTLEKFKKENLYDYLLKENIAFFKQKIYSWNINSQEFEPHKDTFLNNSDAFTKLNLDFVKDENLKKVLSLYQKLEIDSPTFENQLERILFCSQYLIKSDDELLNTLNVLEKEAKEATQLQNIQLEKATVYAKLASKETHPDYNSKAISELERVLATNNNSNAYKIAIQKKEEILSKNIQVELQKYIYNKENSRAFIRYKNTNNLTISFYKINNAIQTEFQNNNKKKDSLVAQIVKEKKPITSKNYQLVDKKDYFEYTTEVLLPQLEKGNYLVYFESEIDSKDKKGFGYETITVSNISVLANRKDDTEYYTVLDRKTGKPMENVSLKSKEFEIKTNAEGLASYKAQENKNHYYNNFPIQLTTANDTIIINKNYLAYASDYSEKEEDENIKGKVEFYLDRAIYRPGQTVYYKGIAIQKKKNQSSVVPNTTFKITIQDPNYTNFKEFEVTTNEIGSFSGEFVLPKTGLTGDFRIEAEEPDDYKKDNSYNKEKDEHPFWDNVHFENTNAYFKVEEYKRPKFEVTFEPKKESFQVNQSVSVKGIAKAFAGSSISDAKVSYTITRFTNFYRNYYGNEQSEIIATSETKTDATGKFVIDFIAKPSANADKNQLPVFNYRVDATVTDINGETHSAVTTIKVGYHDLMLTTTIPNRIETKNKNEITLNSTNLNGEFKATKGEIKMYFVSSFPNKFKSRVFPQPEIKTISDTEFEKLFPYEINSSEKLEKKTEKLVFSKTIDTEKDKKIALDFISNYQSGNYKIIFSAKDSFDNPIENVSNFSIIQSKNKFNPNTLFTVEQINKDPKKDGFITIQIHSVIDTLHIHTTGNYKNSTFYEKNIVLENHQARLTIPIQKDFEKLLKFGFESIFENQPFNNQLEVALKFEEPKMDFSVESFRNKIQPGSNENWSFKLNASNTKSEAEILVSMYDSSLDQFTQKEWSSLDFYDYNYNGVNYRTSLGFDKTHTYIRSLNSKKTRIHLNNEDTKLMWFGFDFNEANPRLIALEYKNQLNRKAKKPQNAKTVYGYVLDSKSYPLPGVQITVKGTTRNTQTDFDGYYEIDVAKNEELVFSYLGFESQTQIVEDDKNLDVILKEDENTLNEVVVVGYGSQKKSDLTGAVAAITLPPPPRVDEAKDMKIRGSSSINGATPLYIIDGEIASEEAFKRLNPSDIVDIAVLKNKDVQATYGSRGVNGVIIITTKKALEALTQVKARKNLSETAFFFPNLKTDAKGKVSFNFTSPEALTAWKLRLLAHNKEAVTGYLEKTVLTQKELMIVPNFPRFFREKDTIVISAKISNLTNETKTGIASLQFFDATTMQPIDAKMLNAKNIKNFTAKALGNTTATWTITIPEGLQGVQYKIVAKAGNYSDGEENILPVLTNNMLVTESIPIWVRENSKKEYTFNNLKNNNSATLKNHQFTLEYTSNPTWLAIQSLPYLMEYEHECAEQTFARFYANALATEIISSNPKIATVFEDWRKNGKLNSKLEENEELKSIILAETPWLNDAQSEDEKKKNLALLFDLEKMKTSQETTFQKLKQKQKPSGGFAWFDGSDESEYITRHILAGLGHLSKLNPNDETIEKIDEITEKGIPFLDQKFLEYYKQRTEKLKASEKLIWPNPYSDLHYLYTRSFYLKDYPLSDTLKKATKLYLETAKKDWLNYSLYEKGLASLTLNRFGEKEAAKKIIESLKETASNNEDWGMYWIANKSGWFWYQAPIETQALLIEAFAEVNNDTKSVDAMKVWLLKNKQTKNWPTTKSTTEAVYALLMQGTDWLSVKDNTVIKIGDEKILTKKLSENEKEAETGYVKLNWKADEINKEMASITVENKSKVPAFGGVYWQYFEDLDKIKNNSNTNLSVSKDLYIKNTTLKGNELQKITSKNSLKVGDLVTVRLVISAKENIEFVHLKDMRASCFEPVDVLSGYEYKGGLGFYKSTKDVATHFFFENINKGTYVLEYDIRVNSTGNFSNGITTIQSMYAPEYSSHSKGIRVKAIINLI